MKKTTLINAPLSTCIAKLGHTDTICLCDCGLPVPPGVERIDLALHQGMPRFMDVLNTIASELVIEKMTIATEMEKISPDFHKEFLAAVKKISEAQGKPIEVEEVAHVDFKKKTASCHAIVRSGEITYYANVIIHAGVAF